MIYRLSYYPWLTQNVPQEEIRRQIEIFAATIAEELKKLGAAETTVQVLPALDVPAQIEQLIAGGAQIALMNPLGFVFARNRTGDVEAVAVAQRIIDGKVGSVYFAQLYLGPLGTPLCVQGGNAGLLKRMRAHQSPFNPRRYHSSARLRVES